MKRWLIVTASMIAVVAIAGCSSESAFTDGTTTTTTAPGAAMCTAEANLEQSVQALADPDVLTSGSDGIKDTLEAVQQDLEDLANAAQQSLKPQIDDLMSAVDGLQSAVDDLSGGNLVSGISAVASAISDVASSGQALYDAVKDRCPAGTSSTTST